MRFSCFSHVRQTILIKPRVRISHWKVSLFLFFFEGKISIYHRHRVTSVSDALEVWTFLLSLNRHRQLRNACEKSKEKSEKMLLSCPKWRIILRLERQVQSREDRMRFTQRVEIPLRWWIISPPPPKLLAGMIYNLAWISAASSPSRVSFSLFILENKRKT